MGGVEQLIFFLKKNYSVVAREEEREGEEGEEVGEGEGEEEEEERKLRRARIEEVRRYLLMVVKQFVTKVMVAKVMVTWWCNAKHLYYILVALI